MANLMTDDAMRTRRAYRNQTEDDIWAEDQLAGLTALISIAQRIERDGGLEREAPGRSAPAHHPAWLASQASGGQEVLTSRPSPVGQQDGSRHRSAGSIPRSALANTGAMALQIKRLSVGRVAEATRYGPVLSVKPQRRRLDRNTFAPALRPRDRRIIAVLSVLWAVCLADFWQWWLEPVHQTSAYGTALNGVVLGYLTCFPVFFIVAVNRLRVVNRNLRVPWLRVAFIVTRAPSEPWPVAEATLRAMLDQDFPLPYDVWLADENPTDEILRWCAGNGVIVSTRNGVGEYHRPTWPRRTKCKEGNLAFFYDHWGYRSYDVVAQLDCDHVPAPTYLGEMVRPFSDPAIGYVAAPSICDTNAGESWSARGRLHAESTFHGAFQLGHSAGWSPLCIGSHYAVRTSALRDIGGIGPELAEDFSTTFLLNSAGWHGAFAIDAEAHGDGPGTFAAMLVQEFQWSKSLTVLLFKLVPRNLTRLDWPHRFRFIYALCYYFLLTISTVIGVLLAPFAAVTGKPWMNVNYFAFVLHWWSLSILLILLAVLLRRNHLLRPADAPLFSWENWLYVLVRWPYILRGVCSAFVYAIRPRAVTFKVTPKGVGELETLPTRLMVPYLIISLLCSASAVAGERFNNAAGYVFLCILGALTYTAVSSLIPVLHAKEMAQRVGMTTGAAIRLTSVTPFILGILSVLPVLYAAAHYPAYAEHVFNWSFNNIHLSGFH
jgi:cellulose synthase/poly-beta-1,6-N-acetylglucosamine synthase-like glycosyltransferase